MVRIRTVDEKKNAGVVGSDMDNISIVESDDLFASDENDQIKVKFHQKLEPKGERSPEPKAPVAEATKKMGKFNQKKTS